MAHLGKRSRPDANGGGFAGPKRSKDSHSSQPGSGGKSTPCTKFFSPYGCPYGEACHFQHYVPGGFNAMTQMTNMGNKFAVPPRNQMAPHAPHATREAPPAAKTRICNKYNTAEGCRFGEKCHYAHGEREIGKPLFPSYHDAPQAGPAGGRYAGHFEPPPPAAAAVAASFGASATAKISVDGSLAGAIIGKGGANTKHIYQVTGAKLFIRDHESDANKKNIELEGSFDQIKEASTMVKDLIVSISMSIPPAKNHAAAPAVGPGSAKYKKKLCEKFAKGGCTFGDRCNFAHGESELRV